MTRKLSDEIRKARRIERDALFGASLPEALVTVAAMKGRCYKESRGDSIDHCIYVVFLSDESTGSLNTGDGISVFQDDPKTSNCTLVVDRNRKIRFAINPQRRIEKRYWVGFGLSDSRYVKAYESGVEIPSEWPVYRVWYSDSVCEEMQ